MNLCLTCQNLEAKRTPIDIFISVFFFLSFFFWLCSFCLLNNSKDIQKYRQIFIHRCRKDVPIIQIENIFIFKFASIFPSLSRESTLVSLSRIFFLRFGEFAFVSIRWVFSSLAWFELFQQRGFDFFFLLTGAVRKVNNDLRHSTLYLEIPLTNRRKT